MYAVICYVCPAKKFLFAAGCFSVIFFIYPTHTHIVGKLVVKKLFVDFAIPRFESGIAAHCLSPSPQHVSRAFGRWLYLWHKNSQRFLDVGLG
jgi:hypothetical protein